MTSLALLLIGFSVFSALTVAITHFREEHYPGQALSRTMGLTLLLALVTLQLAHFAWLYLDVAWIKAVPYRVALFSVAPLFFLFGQPLLRPQTQPQNRSQTLPHVRLVMACHAIPIAAAPFLPYEWALPLAFVVGAAYLLWLAHTLYALRSARARFQLEMALLGGVFAIAIVVSILGLMQAVLPDKLFYCLYAIAIGGAFLLVQTTLGLRPQLTNEVSEVVQAAYATSTLANVDCESVLAQFDQLMGVDRIFMDPELSLPNLAQRLQLSPHQLSEWMNTRLGKGFSRFLREQRIDAAKTMLRDQPSASVLSVGLSVGFSSQSNFYEAFREIEGMTPGRYRTLHAKAAAPA